jgi:outer membrane autotransporter protein
VILTTIPTFGDGNFGPLTINQQATADYLDLLIPFGVSVAPNADLAYVAAQLGLDPNIPAGLDDLHPEWYNGYTEAGLFHARAGVGVASNRLRGARNGIRVNTQVVKFGGGSAVGGTRNEDRFSFWLSGQWGNTDIRQDDRGFLGYDMDHLSGYLGFDYQVNSQFIVGIMAGFGNTDMDVKGRLGEGDVDTWQIAGYATFYGKRWFVDVIGGIGDMSITTERDITFGLIDRVARAKHDGNIAYVHAKAGYSFQVLDGWFTIPMIGITYAHIGQGEVTETGAGAVSLEVERHGTDSLRLEANMVLTKAFPVGNNRKQAFQPYLRVGIAHELENELRPIRARFAGQLASFTVWGEPGANTVFTFGAGLNWIINPAWSIFFDYSSEFGGDFTTHLINGGVRIRF